MHQSGPTPGIPSVVMVRHALNYDFRDGITPAMDIRQQIDPAGYAYVWNDDSVFGQ